MREDDDNDNDIKTTIRQISSQNSCKDAQTTTTKSPQHFLKLIFYSKNKSKYSMKYERHLHLAGI